MGNFLHFCSLCVISGFISSGAIAADCGGHSINLSAAAFGINGFQAADLLYQTASSQSLLYESYSDYDQIVNWHPPLKPNTDFNNRVWACGTGMQCPQDHIVLARPGHGFANNNYAVKRIYQCDVYGWVGYDIYDCSQDDVISGTRVSDLENTDNGLYYQTQSGAFCQTTSAFVNCAKAKNSGQPANWNGSQCDCGTEHTWNGTKCVAKTVSTAVPQTVPGPNSEDTPDEPVVTPTPQTPAELVQPSEPDYECDQTQINNLLTLQVQYATNTSIVAQINQVIEYCDGDPSEIVFNSMINQINIAISGVNTQAEQNQANQRIDQAVATLNSIRDGLRVNKWRNEEGKFNTSRLLSDSIAGVVLGTAGGLITSSVVKKSQVSDGFEDMQCTIGGQVVAGWGDQFRVGIQ